MMAGRRGSLALDDVTFWSKICWFLPILVPNFGNRGRSQITSPALEGGVFKL